MGIFISYRREDAAEQAKFLYQFLAERSGKEIVFLDMETLQGGDDFEKKIKTRIRSATHMLVLIGPKWLETLNARHSIWKTDYVRLEIKTGLATEAKIIPVLLDGARMPGRNELPRDIRGLYKRNAIRLRTDHLAADAEAILPKLTWSARPLHILGNLVAIFIILTMVSATITTYFAPSIVLALISCAGAALSLIALAVALTIRALA